jgi:AcrR family transcriptional regulator
VNAPLGRREAHKQATRASLREAAERLYAEQGYETTTVREIARAAGVTERTFYRYFDGKEGLLAEQALAWIDVLYEAIRQRPPDERPFTAVRCAMLEVAAQLVAQIGRAPARAAGDRPAQPFELLQRATHRPLARIEDAIAAAIVTRPGAGDEFEARLLARVALAALRTAAGRHRELQAGGGGASPGLVPLLEQAFAVVAGLSGA